MMPAIIKKNSKYAFQYCLNWTRIVELVWQLDGVRGRWLRLAGVGAKHRIRSTPHTSPSLPAPTYLLLHGQETIVSLRRECFHPLAIIRGRREQQQPCRGLGSCCPALLLSYFPTLTCSAQPQRCVEKVKRRTASFPAIPVDQVVTLILSFCLCCASWASVFILLYCFPALLRFTSLVRPTVTRYILTLAP